MRTSASWPRFAGRLCPYPPQEASPPNTQRANHLAHKRGFIIIKVFNLCNLGSLGSLQQQSLAILTMPVPRLSAFSLHPSLSLTPPPPHPPIRLLHIPRKPLPIH